MLLSIEAHLFLVVVTFGCLFVMGYNVAVIVLGKRDVVVSAVSCSNVMLLPFIASLEKDLGDALKTYPARYPHAFSCPHSQHTLMYTLFTCAQLCFNAQQHLF